jgi:hypothetical protein
MKTRPTSQKSAASHIPSYPKINMPTTDYRLLTTDYVLTGGEPLPTTDNYEHTPIL